MFDPVKAAKPEIKTKEVDGVGTIRYGPLTVGDIIEVMEGQRFDEKATLTFEQVMKLVYLMLKKAHPELTYEQFKEIPLETIEKIAEAVMSEVDFREV